MVLTTLSILAIGALAGKSAASAAESVLAFAESVPRTSTHGFGGHTFVCETNADFRAKQEGLAIVDHIAHRVVADMEWERDDHAVVQTALLSGVISWGKYGYDLRAEILQMLPTEMRCSVADVIETHVQRLSPYQRQTLLRLAELAQ
jgi:hypothetical protein